jgi:hypothetical protein
MHSVLLIFKGILKNPWIAGFLIFILSQIFLRYIAHEIWGPITCADGWRSSSIGAQGACSHHGGVDRGRYILINFISIGIAIYAGLKAEDIKNKKD